MNFSLIHTGLGSAQKPDQVYNAELCGNFGAAKRLKNCPATAAGYALFIVAPEPENFHHSLVLEHLVDQTMLNINAA